LFVWIIYLDCANLVVFCSYFALHLDIILLNYGSEEKEANEAVVLVSFERETTAYQTCSLENVHE